MSTVEFSAPLDADIVEELEAWFCELEESPWSIFQIRKGEPFFLHGYFGDEPSGWSAWQGLAARFPSIGEQPVVREIADRDWQNAYKEFLQPWHSRGLYWIPVWLKDTHPVPDDAVAVYFDAGMAFGTGSHETTRLCAERLLDLRDEGRLHGASVIDAGCGSGILAISAALLGAPSVRGFDIDPDAVAVSIDNRSKANLNPDQVEFSHAGLKDGLAGIAADFIMANIQSDVLIGHAELFPPAMKAGSRLVLSGVLCPEREAVLQRFSSLPGTPLQFVDSRTQGDWCDLLFQKNAGSI